MVTKRTYRRFAPLLLLIVLSFLVYRVSLHRVLTPDVDNTTESRVKWVIDGDTIILEDGRKVRYAGIDSPERGEPFYRKATRRNMSLVKGRSITIVVCKEKPYDKYGRLLAWVYVDGVDVSAVLLKEGLARVFRGPPCGIKRLEEYREYENMARKKRLGIWKEQRG